MSTLVYMQLQASTHIKTVCTNTYLTWLGSVFQTIPCAQQDLCARTSTASNKHPCNSSTSALCLDYMMHRIYIRHRTNQFNIRASAWFPSILPIHATATITIPTTNSTTTTTTTTTMTALGPTPSSRSPGGCQQEAECWHSKRNKCTHHLKF